jgi:hypothetical protein
MAGQNRAGKRGACSHPALHLQPAPDNSAHLGRAVRGHWSVENRNNHKRDDSVWQEDRHRHRRPRVAQNLALTRNALLAVIPFDEKRNLPSLIAHDQQNPKLAIELIFHAPPQI